MPPKSAKKKVEEEDVDMGSPRGDDEEDAQVQAPPTTDKKTEAAFLDFFRKMDPAAPQTIRFFDRREYYSVHADDAIFVADELYKTKSVIKLWEPGNVPSVWVSRLNFDSFARQLLLERGFKIEVWAQENRQWQLARRASPGHLDSVEDLLFRGGHEMAESPIIVAVKLATKAGQWSVGVAFADTTARKVGVCQFDDNEQLTHLETALVRLGAKECLIPLEGESGGGSASSAAAAASAASTAEGKKLRDVLDRCDVASTQRKKTEFNPKDMERDLPRLVGKDSRDIPQLQLEHAMGALACVIRYVELLSDESNLGTFSLQTIDLNQFMSIDAAATRALNLFPAPGDTNKNMSLFGLLNKCKTAIGSRVLSQWIKQPLLNLEEINARLDLVDLFVTDAVLRGSLRETHLKRVPDLGRLTRKFLRRKGATLQDAVKLYDFVRLLPSLLATLRDASDSGSEQLSKMFIAPLEVLVKDFDNFVQMIEVSVDLEAAGRGEFLINPKYDDDLLALSKLKDKALRGMRSECSRTADDIGLSEEKVKLEWNASLGYFMRIVRKDEKVLRTKKQYTVLETRKDGVRFLSPTLRTLAAEYKEHADSYNVQQQALIISALEVVAGYCPAIEQLCDLVAQLDVFVSLAHVACHAPTPYTRPVLSAAGEGNIVLERCRHPCLEAMEGVQFIPNDVRIIRGESQFQIITGPNMGGKSTYIRQIGVAVLMAQIGSFVPADSAEINVTHAIFARIGASDNQLKGVSTFMAEMLETATILQAADEKSLIIVDELGRGTSTYDGFGLAWAISEHIVKNIKAPTLFASHFHELTELASSCSGVKNLHVEAVVDGQKLTMLYSVKDGPCDESFGIHVAELAGFPPRVVESAKRKAEALESFHSEAAPDAMNDDDDAGAGKRARREEKEGRQLVLSFLQSFAKLPLGSLTPDDARVAVKELKDQLLASGNTFVLRMIDSAVSAAAAQ